MCDRGCMVFPVCAFVCTPAGDGWPLLGRVLDHVQTDPARAAGHRRHQLVALHPAQVEFCRRAMPCTGLVDSVIQGDCEGFTFVVPSAPGQHGGRIAPSEPERPYESFRRWRRALSHTFQSLAASTTQLSCTGSAAPRCVDGALGFMPRFCLVVPGASSVRVCV